MSILADSKEGVGLFSNPGSGTSTDEAQKCRLWASQGDSRFDDVVLGNAAFPDPWRPGETTRKLPWHFDLLHLSQPADSWDIAGVSSPSACRLQHDQFNLTGRGERRLASNPGHGL